MPIRNCGVIIATKATYRKLYYSVAALLPVVEAVFPHWAAIQFCICYCVSRFLKLATMPRMIHTHGHFGMPTGAFWGEYQGEAGTVFQTMAYDKPTDTRVSRPAVFRHAMNLLPDKGPIFVGPIDSKQTTTKKETH